MWSLCPALFISMMTFFYIMFIVCILLTSTQQLIYGSSKAQYNVCQLPTNIIIVWFLIDFVVYDHSSSRIFIPDTETGVDNLFHSFTVRLRFGYNAI